MWQRSKPKLPEIILFWNYLKHFLDAGLPMVLAFHQLAKVLVKKPWPQILKRIEIGLLSGKKLSQSLAEEKYVFKTDVGEMIAIAEKKGNYPDVIAVIVAHLKWQLQTRQSIHNALRYPIVLMFIMCVIFYLILHHIVPQLQEYLAAMGHQSLPLATQILLMVSSAAPFGFITMSLFGLFVFLSFKINLSVFKKSRWFLEKQVLRMPVVGRLVDKLMIINFIRVLSILLDSGGDLLVSLHQSIKVVPNAWRAAQLEKGKNRLIQGEKLSTALSDVLKRHPALSLLLDLGEQTGKLPVILNEYVVFEMAQFKNEVDQRIQSIQPLLILVMGGMLIWVVISILLPMYDQRGTWGLT